MKARTIFGALALALICLISIFYFNRKVDLDVSSGQKNRLAPVKALGEPEELRDDGDSKDREFRVKQSSKRANSINELVADLKIENVAESFDQLRLLAESGNTTAACMLSVELVKCSNLRLSSNVASRVAASLENANGAPSEREINIVAALKNQAESQADSCDSVTDEMLAAAYDMQVLAAKDGSYSRWLAVNPALNRQDFLSDIDRWVDYKERAKRYFDDALRRQDLVDLPYLLQVYSPADTLTPRPPYRVDDLATFASLYQVAMANGIPVSREISESARSVLASQHAGSIRSFGVWKKGSTPLSVNVADIYPTNSDEFCR